MPLNPSWSYRSSVFIESVKKLILVDFVITARLITTLSIPRGLPSLGPAWPSFRHVGLFHTLHHIQLWSSWALLLKVLIFCLFFFVVKELDNNLDMITPSNKTTIHTLTQTTFLFNIIDTFIKQKMAFMIFIVNHCLTHKMPACFFPHFDYLK